MLLVIIGAGILIGLVIISFSLVMRWAMGFVSRDLVARLQAGESIVNNERVPEPWLASYRRRIAALQKAGASQDDINRVGLKARDYCLRKLDELIAFYSKAGVVDTSDTRELLLDALQAARQRWRNVDWRLLFWPDGHSEPGA